MNGATYVHVRHRSLTDRPRRPITINLSYHSLLRQMASQKQQQKQQYKYEKHTQAQKNNKKNNKIIIRIR